MTESHGSTSPAPVPIRVGAFDFILSSDGFEHIEGPIERRLR
jgi:hypothetical protein